MFNTCLRSCSQIPSHICPFIHCSHCTCHPRTCVPHLSAQLLSDPKITFVSFAWDVSDEARMLHTFRFGRSLFGNLYDLQEVAHELGFHKVSQ